MDANCGTGSDRAVETTRPQRTQRGFSARVLLIEDDTLLGMDLALTLQSIGYQSLGPCRTLAEAREAIRTLHPDVAVLDIDLGRSETSIELAAELIGDEIPVVFVSGHSEKAKPLPPTFRGVPRLSKPAEPSDLLREIEQLLDS